MSKEQIFPTSDPEAKRETQAEQSTPVETKTDTEVNEAGVPWKNKFKELERKTEKSTQQYYQDIAERDAQINALKAAVEDLQTSVTKTRGTQEAEELNELQYTNPLEAAKRALIPEFEAKLEQQRKDLMQTFQAQNQRQTQTAQYEAEAVRRYPSLQEHNSEFFQKTSEVYQEMSQDPAVKDHPALALWAANEAAARYPGLEGAALGGFNSDGTPRKAAAFETGNMAPSSRIKKKGSTEDKLTSEDLAYIERINSYGLGVKLTPEKLLKQRKKSRLTTEHALLKKLSENS